MSIYLGDKCSLKDGSEGNCKLIKECPTAVQLIQTGLHPVLCGFETTEPIVCCKDGEGKDETKTTSATTPTNQVISRTPGDISKQSKINLIVSKIFLDTANFYRNYKILELVLSFMY